MCLSFSTRHDGEARLNDKISELKNELAERDETIVKLKKTISSCEEVQKHASTVTDELLQVFSNVISIACVL